ncbi:MAG: PCMD domain-containing protein [Prevotella sp.]|nr:PCMD domain-containing protein [Prevotella sp.]
MLLRNLFAVCLLSVLCVSCIKDEELTWEADITDAWVHFDNGDWSTFFYQASDTSAVINADYSSSIITFNVRKDIDSLLLTALAPQFNITEGATITPASGTVLDFSNGGQTYTVVSPGNAKSTRTYNVRFSPQVLPTYFSFDNYYLDDSGKYYVWSDYSNDEEPDWGSANPGFALARGTAGIEEYPSLPDPTGGVDGGPCVKLTTCDLGAWGTITNKRIAAGNFFLGSFDLSKALTATLQSTLFGLPVNFKPVRMTGYYKYTPGEEMMDRSGNKLDTEDTAALYIQLYRNHDADGNYVVLTGENTADSELRVGRGDVDVVPTTEWTYFDIAIDYWDEVDPELLANMGYNLSIVCSSSKRGSYYEGAVGSTLYIDNFSVIVEE